MAPRGPENIILWLIQFLRIEEFEPRSNPINMAPRGPENIILWLIQFLRIEEFEPLVQILFAWLQEVQRI
jgi:hypothetical protein